MNRVILLSIFACLSLFAVAAASDPIYAEVLLTPSKPHGVSIITYPAPFAPTTYWLAWGSFTDTMNTTGWSYLDIQSNPDANSTQQAFAAGYLEGFVTAQRSYEFITNMNHGPSTWSPMLTQYLKQNLDWVDAQVQAHSTDLYWSHVGYVYSQLRGMWTGYTDAMPNQPLDFLTYYSSTLVGDLDDLCRQLGCVSPSQQPVVQSDGHCSVLIKAIQKAGVFSDLLASHTTWGSFESMTRIYKRYNLPLNGAVANAISFSSYAACIYSNDDWYQTSAGLVVTETTINNHNATLDAMYVTPQSVLDFARNMVANRLAADGKSWMKMFGQYNSGTYNNMFSVVDYKLFQPGSATLPPNLLWVGEQMPGYWVFEDRTQWLQPNGQYSGIGQGYFASYNRPSFPFIYNISNQTGLLLQWGDHYSYLNTSRAVIFRREQHTVVDEASLHQLMRYNHFQTEPSGGQTCAPGHTSGSNAIAERGDLTSPDSGCCASCGLAQYDEAAIDVKLTSYARMRGTGDGSSADCGTTLAQSSPTFESQPPFQWSTSPFAKVPHIGQPDLWNFAPVEIDW